MKKKYFLLAVFPAFMLGCQKNSQIAPDAGKAVISIISPQPGTSFRSGDTILLQSETSYPGQLHGYEIKVEDSASGFILFDAAQHIHSDRFATREKWVGNTKAPMKLKLTVSVLVDHNGTEAKQQLDFYVLP